MALKIGGKAPAFKLADQEGNMVELKDYLGQKVALFFYPKDNTPTCTTQACNMRDNISLLAKNGIKVLGISVDDLKSHQKFGTKFALNYPILSDIDKKVVEKYGVWAEKKFMGKTYMGTVRTTFLINELGKIDHIIPKIDAKDHAQQILQVWLNQ